MKDNNELSKENLSHIMKKILKKDIIEIKIEGIEHFESIIEYEFSLIKINVIYKDNKKDEFYVRIIKGGKIKESIFCYWSFLYENYTKKREKKGDSTIQKAIITQISSEENISNLLLTIDSNLNYCAEITLVELKKYFEKENSKERWLNNIEINSNDILFIAKKMY